MACDPIPPIILPLGTWPVTDRELWVAAVSGCSEHDEDNPAPSWRPRTRKKVMNGYGRYLSFLIRRNELLLEECGATRITPERVKAYISEMKNTISSVSAGVYIGALLQAARAFSPPETWTWLSRSYSRLKYRAKPSRNKHSAMRSVGVLYRLGIRLMDSAQLRTGQPLRAAFTYQQGLMIALLAVRPLRISNFTALELGRTLLPDGGGYSIVFNPNELKVAQNGDLNEPFPKELLPYLGQFLSIYRPRLLRQGTPQQSNPLPSRLWIDRFGAPMGEAALRTNIKTVTKRAFGTALWPHLFRDCLVTSVAIEHPEMVHIASVMLGHKSFKTMQDHYNQAKMFESAAKYSETMSELRSESIAELQAEAR